MIRRKKKKSAQTCGHDHDHKNDDHDHSGCSKLAYLVDHYALVNGGWLFIIRDMIGGGQMIDAVLSKDFTTGSLEAKRILDEYDIQKVVGAVDVHYDS